MRTHRFFTGDKFELKKDFWVHDQALLWQWNKVLRFKEGQQVILFDGDQTDRLYKIAQIDKSEAHLQMITELERKIPEPHVYLFWSLLKKDNNDHILQKCTELGVSNFIPLLSERSVRDNFNIDRAHKIVLEASEQSGRSTVPVVREPMHLATALKEYEGKINLIVCEQGNDNTLQIKPHQKYGILIGPEGGWSESEKANFESKKMLHLGISAMTLRAETAAVVASSKLL